eukprot:6777991-Heterocapsa_arctica.AAC.1
MPAWRLISPWPACPPRPPAQRRGRWPVVGTYAEGHGSALGRRREGQLRRSSALRRMSRSCGT